MASRIDTRVGAAALVVAAALLSGCYASTVSDCYYYYGYSYGDPYCEYEYLEPYTPANGYEPASYAEVEPSITPNPSPDVEPKLSDASVQIANFIYLRRTEDTGSTDADDVINERYPCGLGVDALTLCAVENIKARDTDYIIIGVQVEKPVEKDSERDFLVVGFGFDSDNDTTNNYVPPAAREFDYFGGTDRWYAAAYTPTDGWKLQTFGLIDGAPAPIESEARVILQEDTAVLLVPASEFDSVETPGARFSFFRHRGDMGTGTDANWSGLVYPPLGEPLAGL
jgi:hypothetical protein